MGERFEGDAALTIMQRSSHKQRFRNDERKGMRLPRLNPIQRVVAQKVFLKRLGDHLLGNRLCRHQVNKAIQGYPPIEKIVPLPHFKQLVFRGSLWKRRSYFGRENLPIEVPYFAVVWPVDLCRSLPFHLLPPQSA
jgi:hypothetical protein